MCLFCLKFRSHFILKEYISFVLPANFDQIEWVTQLSYGARLLFRRALGSFPDFPWVTLLSSALCGRLVEVLIVD